MRSSTRMIAIGCGLALTVSLSPALPAALAAPSHAAAAGQTATPGAVTKLSGQPDAVTVLSPADAWATQDNGVMFHWTGSAWVKVTALPAGSDAGVESVSGVSPSDVWAVGSSGCPNCTSLAVHWNGTRWRAVPSPSPEKFSGLDSVDAASASDAWAVGSSWANRSNGLSKTLAVRWNGTSWKQVPSPSPAGTAAGLVSVSVVSASDVWAAGFYYHPGVGDFNLLLLHWNGTRWTRVTVPSGFIADAVSAASASDVWVTGPGNMTLHWNGTRWARRAVPSPGGTEYTSLPDVDAISPKLAFAVGSYTLPKENHHQYTLLAQWNGTRWTRVSTPSPGNFSNSLAGVASSSPSNAWAVGGSGFGHERTGLTFKTLMLHWNGTSWTRS